MNGLLLTLVLLHGADATTTATVLDRGGIERNPALSQDIVHNVALQSVWTAGQAIALVQLHRKHARLAKVLGIVALGVEGAIVVRNVRTLQRIR